MALMSESIAIAIFLILLFGAGAVYLYSRITYNEKRLGMMESLLVDIKMMIESSEEERAPVMPVASVYSYPAKGPAVSMEEVEETFENQDESMYTAVLEQADASGKPEESLEVEAEELTEVAEAPVNQKVRANYDGLTRAELAALAEQRNIRVTKRAGRGEIISALRKADESNNSTAATGKEDAPGALFPADGPLGGDLSLDSGNAGAELDA
jgi:hypothetical protein